MAIMLMKDVFGSRPNKQNLKKFFENTAIQALWWPQAIEDETILQGKQTDLFLNSNDLRALIQKQKLDVKKNIIDYFQSLESIYDFFPVL